MGLGDMHPQPTPFKDKGIIEKMEVWLGTMRKSIRENRMSQGELLWFLNLVRQGMTQIYGKDSPIMQHLRFLKPTDKLPRDSATAMASEFSDRVEAFLKGSHDATYCFDPRNSVGKVFIGHGRSPLWRELKDFLADRLKLSWDEFNREPVAGVHNFERLSQMLREAVFAFLIMTPEDEHMDQTRHARENVIHEVGLFQGRLGPRRAIILLHEDCKEFSNIIGLGEIRFSRGSISSAYEDIRRVLEREGIIRPAGERQG